MHARNLLDQTTNVVSGTFKILNIIRRGLVSLAQNPTLVLTALSLYQIVLAQAQVLSRNNLVAYYPLNGTALDFSGNGNHGIENGPIAIANSDGITNGAYLFTQNTFINGSADKLLRGAKTVGFKFRLNADNPYSNQNRGAYLFGFGGGGDGYTRQSFIVIANNCNNYNYANSIEVQAHWDHKKLYAQDNLFAAVPSEWIHVIISTSKHTGTDIYINGELARHGTDYLGDTIVEGAEFTFGTIPDPTGHPPAPNVCKDFVYAPCAISEAYIFKGAITPDEARRWGKAKSTDPIIDLPQAFNYDAVAEDNFYHSWKSIPLIAGASAALTTVGIFALKSLCCPYRKPLSPEEQRKQKEEARKRLAEETRDRELQQLVNGDNSDDEKIGLRNR